MSYSLRKRKSKITKRKYNMTKRKGKKIPRRFKKSRKQYGGSNPFIVEVARLLNNFNFTEPEKEELIDKLYKSEWRYVQVPNRKNLLIGKFNEAINATNSTPDEKKAFIYEIITYWEDPENYIPRPPIPRPPIPTPVV